MTFLRIRKRLVSWPKARSRRCEYCEGSGNVPKPIAAGGFGGNAGVTWAGGQGSGRDKHRAEGVTG